MVLYCSVLTPTGSMKREALLMAVCSILWRAGDSTRAVVALPGEREVFQATPMYRYDGIAEKVPPVFLPV